MNDGRLVSVLKRLGLKLEEFPFGMLEFFERVEKEMGEPLPIEFVKGPWTGAYQPFVVEGGNIPWTEAYPGMSNVNYYTTDTTVNTTWQNGYTTTDSSFLTSGGTFTLNYQVTYL